MKDHFWRTLGYLPDYSDRKSRGNRIAHESRHLGGVFSIDPDDDLDGQYAGNNKVDKGQNLHNLLEAKRRCPEIPERERKKGEKRLFQAKETAIFPLFKVLSHTKKRNHQKEPSDSGKTIPQLSEADEKAMIFPRAQGRNSRQTAEGERERE